MIKEQTEKYSWEFIFMGANIDVAVESEKLGILADRAFAFNASPAGLKKMYKEVCCMASEIRAPHLERKEKKDKAAA
jgi:hypothetical protein